MIGNLWTLGLAAGAAIVVLSLIMFFVGRYKRCPSNKVLVISGKVGNGQSSKCISGGGAFIWPVIQQYAFLDLSPMSLDVPLSDALSLENIRVAVPATVTVAISRDAIVQQNAAARLLDLQEQDIINLAKDLILGQMRQVIASMKIDEINRDRDAFLKKIDASLEPELNKIGLTPINVNIRDIKDASGYIEATGRKAAAFAVQQANADVADQEKAGAIRVAEAQQEKLVKVAEANRTQLIGVANAERDKQIGVTSAQKDQAMRVADFSREQIVSVSAAEATAAEGKAAAAVRQAEAMRLAQSAQAEAEAAVEVARNQAQTKAALANAARVEAEQTAALVSTAKAEAEKVVIQANASKQQKVLAAEAEYQTIFQSKKAEADGILAIANAKAEGMRRMVEAAGGNPEAAYRLLVVEHLDHIADASAAAIKGIKFDKIMVWGGGNGTEVPNFLSSLGKGLPPMLDIINHLTDISVPGLKKGTSVTSTPATSGDSPEVSQDTPTPKVKSTK